MKAGFLRVRLFELFAGDPRWSRSLGRVVLDVRNPGLKIWFLLATEFRGFKDLQLMVVE